MTVKRYKRTRFWGVYDTSGTLICLCVYKKGAQEVVRRIEVVMQQLVAAHQDGCARPSGQPSREQTPLGSPNKDGTDTC